MAAFITLLYNLSLFLLFGLAVFVFFKRPQLTAGRYFSLASLALCLWLGTLYRFSISPESDELTLIGRTNFVAILLAVFLGFMFIRSVVEWRVTYARWLYLESFVLAVLTLDTTLIDAHEAVVGGEHITVVGPLFVLFALHVVAYPVSIVATAISAARHVGRRTRGQLGVIGVGIGAATVIGLLTGIVLPYGFHVFAFEEIGALSVVFVAIAAAYAITVDNLFNVSAVIQKTLVFAILGAIVEGIYTYGIDGLAGHLPGADDSELSRRAISLITVFFIAVTFEPAKDRLERLLSRLMFPRNSRRIAAFGRLR